MVTYKYILMRLQFYKNKLNYFYQNDPLSTKYLEYIDTAKSIWDEFAGPKKPQKLSSTIL